jgi:hypothetical protein
MEVIDLNFHVFVIILTIIIYIILKKRTQSKKNSKFNIIYVLLVPIILYGGNYLLKGQIIKSNFDADASLSDVSDVARISDASHMSHSSILKIPYPMSESSNLSSSN